jgi:hypothetical protein
LKEGLVTAKVHCAVLMLILFAERMDLLHNCFYLVTVYKPAGDILNRNYSILNQNPSLGQMFTLLEQVEEIHNTFYHTFNGTHEFGAKHASLMETGKVIP